VVYSEVIIADVWGQSVELGPGAHAVHYTTNNNRSKYYDGIYFILIYLQRAQQGPGAQPLLREG